MTRRRFIGSAAAMLTSAGLAETSGASFVHSFDKEYFIDWTKSILNISWPKIADNARFRVIGDTHFNYYDERDKEYASNYARMSGLSNKNVNLPSQSPRKYFEQALSSAKKDGVDAILLVGVILDECAMARK